VNGEVRYDDCGLDHVTVFSLVRGHSALHYNDNAAPRRMQLNLAGGLRGAIPLRTLSTTTALSGSSPFLVKATLVPSNVVYTVSFDCQQFYPYRPQRFWKDRCFYIYDGAIRLSRRILLTICGPPAPLFLLAVSPCTT